MADPISISAEIVSDIRALHDKCSLIGEDRSVRCLQRTIRKNEGRKAIPAKMIKRKENRGRNTLALIDHEDRDPISQGLKSLCETLMKTRSKVVYGLAHGIVSDAGEKQTCSRANAV